jgi:MFS family permease
MRARFLVRSARPVPVEHRANFIHLYFDIAWYGVLAASTISFTAVYATHHGANAFQLGLLSAGPAVVNIAVTLPVGRWLEKPPLAAAVFWSAVFHRLFYLLWLPLPILLGPQAQIWVLIILTLLMNIPGTSLAVGFNALFAEVVPPDWRGHVAGARNALLSLTFIVVSVLCGRILNTLPFPINYQVVFALGFLGAAMSTLHLWFVTPPSSGQAERRVGRGLGSLGAPGMFHNVVRALRPGVAWRFLKRLQKPYWPSPGVQGSPFGRLVAVLFAFNLALYLAIPLFPIRWVNQLQLSDQEIGWGTAVFYVSVFLGSTQLDRLVRRLGNRRVTALGAIFMSSYPAFMALAQGLGLFLVGSAAGGFGWALVGGSLINYVLEKVPEDRRPAYLAWYNLAMNTALLLGSLIGPFVAGFVGVSIALGVFAVLRLLAALAIWRWE